MTTKYANHVPNRQKRRIHVPFHHWKRETQEEHETRAARWFESSIASWEREGRLTKQEADDMRTEVKEPQVVAVLSHLGAHIAMSIPLRFPLGSIARVAYSLFFLMLSTIRFALRRTDRKKWIQALHIHSPIVIVLAGIPGFGMFAYLASNRIRSNRLLVRVALDAVFLKLPWRLYERTGARWVNARPANLAQPVTPTQLPLRATVWPQSIVLVLGCIIGALAFADIAIEFADVMLAPSIPGWHYIMRIFDLNAEQSLGTWYAIVSLLFLSALLFTVAYAKYREGDRFSRHWFILALLPLGFSIDEQAKLHDPGGLADTVRGQLPLYGPLYTGWVIFGLISAMVIAFLFKGFMFDLPQKTRYLFMLAAAGYIGGELILEMASGWYLDMAGQENLIYQVITTFEESIAMTGILIAIAAVLLYIQNYVGGLGLIIGQSQSSLTFSEVPAQSMRPDTRALTPATLTNGDDVVGQHPRGGSPPSLSERRV